MEDTVSARKVNKIMKFVADKKKEERKCNIGYDTMDMRDNKKKVEILFKDKLKVNSKTISCRMNGYVIIVKLKNEEKEKEIM